MPDDLRDLVDRARRGDPVAFEALYDRFERSVFALCHHLLGSHDAALEATQETFVNVWEKLPTLRHPEAFSTWLRGAAVNACRHLRRKRRWLSSWSEVSEDGEPGDVAGDEPAVSATLEQDELSARLAAALRKLSPDHREVVVLHHLQELPLVDVAAVLGVPVGTVKSRLGRAREHLERLLKPYLEE